MKKFLSGVLAAICLTGACTIPAMAASPCEDAAAMADALHTFGLFSGTGTNADGTPIYSLEAVPTRQEALVMLIRLLGKESQAQKGEYSHPFADVDAWADPYVAYAYENNLASGVSATSFGGNSPISAQQYVTFLLRALGYNEAAGDFTYQNALSFSDSIGLTEGKYTLGDTFLRRDIVWLSTGALFQPMKSSDIPLVKQLSMDGVITDDAYEKGLYILAATNILENKRYIHVEDNSGEPNYIIDTKDLYTIPGSGQTEGYQRIMGFLEDETYPLFFKIVTTNDTLGIEWMSQNLPAQNAVRMQSYENTYLAEMAWMCYNYSVSNYNYAWNADEEISIDPVFMGIADHLTKETETPTNPPEEILWISLTELRFLTGKTSLNFDTLPDQAGNYIYCFLLDTAEPKILYQFYEMPYNFGSSGDETGTFNGVQIKQDNGVIYFSYQDLVHIGLLQSDGSLNENIQQAPQESTPATSQEEPASEESPAVSEWISASTLNRNYGYSVTWLGDEIWLTKTDWDTKEETAYHIAGAPESSFEKDKIYSGSWKGHTILFQYPGGSVSSSLLFYTDDLDAAGIL